MSLANVLFHGVIAGDGSSVRPWHLEDVSKHGARFRIDGAREIPDSFTLMVKGDDMKLVTCKVVWRSDSFVGVKFEQS
jgi:hypothetical protein